MNDGNHLSAHEGSLCLFSGPCKLYSVCAPFVTFSHQDDSQSLAFFSLAIRELLSARCFFNKIRRGRRRWAPMLFLQDRRGTGTPARPAGATPDQLLLRAALLPVRRPLVCPGDDRHALELRAANHAQHSLCQFRVCCRQEQTPRRAACVPLVLRPARQPIAAVPSGLIEQPNLRHSSALGRLRLHGWHPDASRSRNCSPAPTVACCKPQGRHHQHAPTRRALRWCGKR